MKSMSLYYTQSLVCVCVDLQEVSLERGGGGGSDIRPYVLGYT